MIGALGAAGTPEDAREPLWEIVGMDVVDRPSLTIPSNETRFAERTIETLAVRCVFGRVLWNHSR